MPTPPVIIVVLASEAQTEDDARECLTTNRIAADEIRTYRGLWRPPTPERPLVHLFTDRPNQLMIAAGWRPDDPGSIRPMSYLHAPTEAMAAPALRRAGSDCA